MPRELSEPRSEPGVERAIGRLEGVVTELKDSFNRRFDTLESEIRELRTDFQVQTRDAASDAVSRERRISMLEANQDQSDHGGLVHSMVPAESGETPNARLRNGLILSVFSAVTAVLAKWWPWPNHHSVRP